MVKANGVNPQPSTLPDPVNAGVPLLGQMWSDEVEEFSRADNLRALPELREMTLITGHEIVSSTSIRALHEQVVVRIDGHLGQV